MIQASGIDKTGSVTIVLGLTDPELKVLRSHQALAVKITLSNLTLTVITAGGTDNEELLQSPLFLDSNAKPVDLRSQKDFDAELDTNGPLIPLSR